MTNLTTKELMELKVLIAKSKTVGLQMDEKKRLEELVSRFLNKQFKDVSVSELLDYASLIVSVINASSLGWI